MFVVRMLIVFLTLFFVFHAIFVSPTTVHHQNYYTLKVCPRRGSLLNWDLCFLVEVIYKFKQPSWLFGKLRGIQGRKKNLTSMLKFSLYYEDRRLMRTNVLKRNVEAGPSVKAAHGTFIEKNN